jgi:hypothetical protein
MGTLIATGAMFVANNGLDIAIENFHAPLPKGRL